MYIMVEDPDTGKRLYADLCIREAVLEAGAFPPTEIVDVEVVDTCTENDLAKAVSAGLKGNKILNSISFVNILRDTFRIFHVPEELLESIHALMEEAVPVIE